MKSLLSVYTHTHSRVVLKGKEGFSALSLTSNTTYYLLQNGALYQRDQQVYIFNFHKTQRKRMTKIISNKGQSGDNFCSFNKHLVSLVFAVLWNIFCACSLSQNTRDKGKSSPSCHRAYVRGEEQKYTQPHLGEGLSLGMQEQERYQGRALKRGGADTARGGRDQVHSQCQGTSGKEGDTENP